jgi:hypothetical protein
MGKRSETGRVGPLFREPVTFVAGNYLGLLDFVWVVGIRRSNRMEPWVGWLGRMMAARLDPSMRFSLSFKGEMRTYLVTQLSATAPGKP